VRRFPTPTPPQQRDRPAEIDKDGEAREDVAALLPDRSDSPTAASAIKRVVLIDRSSGIQYGRDNEQYSSYRVTLPSVALESSTALAEHLLSDDRPWSRDVFTHDGQASFAGLAGAGGSFSGVTEAAVGETLVIIRNSRGVQVGDGNTQHNKFQIRITDVAVNAVQVGQVAASRAAVDRLCQRPSPAAAEALAGQIARIAREYLIVDLTAQVTRDVGNPVIRGWPAEIRERTGVQAGGSARAHVRVEVEVAKMDTSRLAGDLLEAARGPTAFRPSGPVPRANPGPDPASLHAADFNRHDAATDRAASIRPITGPGRSR
jgi:hypothetical protein